MNRVISFFLFVCFLFATAVHAQHWQQTNGPSGGVIKSIGVNSKGHIFIVSNSLFRSTNRGQSWSRFAIPAKATTINISPTDQMFISVSDQFDPDNIGLWRSLDNGETWQRIGSKPLTSMLRDGTLYAADANGYLTSADNGFSWRRQVTYGIEKPGPIWRTRTGIYFIISNKGLYRSIDTGRTWSKSNFSLVEQFAEAPNGDLYVGANGTLSTTHILFKSTDDGKSWMFDSIKGDFFDDFYGIVISPQARIAAIVRRLSIPTVFISDDDGKNWRVSSYSILLVCDSSGVFFGASASTSTDRLFTSTFDSAFATDYIDVPNSSVASVYKYPGGDMTSVAGHDLLARDNWLSTDDGEHWEINTNGASNFHPVVESHKLVAIDSQHNILGFNYSTLFKSADNGRSWKSIGFAANNYTGIVVHSNGSIFITTSTDGVFRSTDSGLTWTAVNYGILSPHLYSIALHSNGDLYVGGDSVVYRSSDLGYSWNPLSASFSSGSGPVSGIIINHRGEVVAALKNNGVFSSTDNGSTWNRRDGMLLIHPPINALLNTPSGFIFAATNSGVFFLDTNRNSNWQSMNDGLTVQQVTSMCIDNDGRLFTGTNGAGVFKSTQTFNVAHQVGVEQTESKLINLLGSTFPNPISTIATIPFTIIETGTVRLDVTDALGRVMAVTADGVYEAGSHTATFDAKGLSAGVYYVRLRSGGRSDIKMTVKTSEP